MSFDAPFDLYPVMHENLCISVPPRDRTLKGVLQRLTGSPVSEERLAAEHAGAIFDALNAALKTSRRLMRADVNSDEVYESLRDLQWRLEGLRVELLRRHGDCPFDGICTREVRDESKGA